MNKKYFIWAAIVAAVVAIYWFFFRNSGAKTANPATVATTSTQKPLSAYSSVWDSFNTIAQSSTTATVANAFKNLFNTSNNFGVSDGGNSGGVSIAGSASGGVQSSGSGAGVPTPDNGDNYDYSDFGLA